MPVRVISRTLANMPGVPPGWAMVHRGPDGAGTWVAPGHQAGTCSSAARSAASRP